VSAFMRTEPQTSACAPEVSSYPDMVRLSGAHFAWDLTAITRKKRRCIA
jgi:hypothetical protein